MEDGIRRIIELIIEAEHYHDLFIPNEHQIQYDYRNYMRMLLYPLPEPLPQTDEAHKRLTDFYGAAMEAFLKGTWEAKQESGIFETVDKVPTPETDSQEKQGL